MKIYLIFIPLLAALFSFSCKENFDPEAPFKEKYVLNCIISGDSVMQVATLGKTYDANGNDPSLNNIDPSISGAQVFIKWKGKIFQMRDSSMARTDTSRYKGPVKFYYTKAFIPTFHDSIEISAIPTNGVVLSSKTMVPNNVSFQRSTTYILKETFTLDIGWIEPDGNNLFLPRLKILYYKRNESPAVLHTLEIPLAYNIKGGITTPVYPSVSQASTIEYQRSIIDDYMLKVSAGDDKLNYQFVYLQLDLLVFDQFLAGYISTANGFLDNLSIRLDEPNYTNINGGLGIFGAYIYNNTSIYLSDDYLTLLGYTP
jgi:hypothetical protein